MSLPANCVKACKSKSQSGLAGESWPVGDIEVIRLSLTDSNQQFA
jgi:hypothetical protein